MEPLQVKKARGYPVTDGDEDDDKDGNDQDEGIIDLGLQ